MTAVDMRMVNCALIPLTRGLVARIDAADLDRVSAFKWHAGRHGYAQRSGPRSEGKPIIYLHRFIVEAPPGVDVDHINRDKLDCRRSNLRCVAHRVNCWNTTKSPRTSIYRGVHQRAATGRWVAQITINRRASHIGTFDTEIEAALAFDRAARRIRGADAVLNFDSAELPPAVRGAA